MALPSSGTISMQDMREESETGNPVSLSAMADLFGVSYTTSGTNDLKFSEFYGKSAGTPYPFNVGSYQIDSRGNICGVTWSVPTSNPFTILGYYIWSRGSGGTWTSIGSVSGSSSTSYSDNTTRAGELVYYRVQAYGSGSLRSPSTADMDNSGTTFPPTTSIVPEDLTSTS